MSTPQARPILMSAPMVRALLAGTKTQTRRTVGGLSKRFPLVQLTADASFDDPFAWGWKNAEDGVDAPLGSWIEWCPYGKPGDRLWVRETWLPDAPRDGTWADVEFFGCKGAPLSLIPENYRTPVHCLFRATWTGHDLVWRPSIFMPRWASRITLEVTDVRVQRLQDISDEDVIAEGIQRTPVGRLVTFEVPGTQVEKLAPVPAYQALWDTINGAGSWESNPWIWAITFKRLQP